MDFEEFKNELNITWNSDEKLEKFANYNFIKELDNLHKAAKPILQIWGNLFGTSIYYENEINKKLNLLNDLRNNI